MIFKNLLKKFYKMSVNAKILKSLQFYQDNDMNELYGTKDDIELQKKLKLSINLSAKKTSSAINSFKKNPIERIEHQESKNAPNEIAHQYPIQKTLNNSQPIILNTDQAIFKLANLNKNNQQNPEKFIAINDIISEAKKLANCAQNIEELRKIVGDSEFPTITRCAPLRDCSFKTFRHV